MLPSSSSLLTQLSTQAIFQRLVLKNAQERATTLETQLRNTVNEGTEAPLISDTEADHAIF